MHMAVSRWHDRKEISDGELPGFFAECCMRGQESSHDGPAHEAHQGPGRTTRAPPTRAQGGPQGPSPPGPGGPTRAWTTWAPGGPQGPTAPGPRRTGPTKRPAHKAHGGLTRPGPQGPGGPTGSARHTRAQCAIPLIRDKDDMIQCVIQVCRSNTSPSFFFDRIMEMRLIC